MKHAFISKNLLYHLDGESDSRETKLSLYYQIDTKYH